MIKGLYRFPGTLVAFLEDLVVGIEGGQHVEEPLLVRLLLLEDFNQSHYCSLLLISLEDVKVSGEPRGERDYQHLDSWRVQTGLET